MIENAPKRVEQKKEDIPSLMLPLSGRVLLVPTVSVAEIVHFETPKAVVNSPDWLLGTMMWRELEIPLISYEVLNGEDDPGVNALTRVTVLNNSGLSEDLNFYALVTQGTPKLSRITEDDVELNKGAKVSDFETLAVLVESEEMCIPDLSKIERAYLDWAS